MRKNLGAAASGSDPTQYVTVSFLAGYAYGKSSLSWCPEMVCTSAAVADGYNDMPGGIAVEPGPAGTGVIIDSVYVRVGTIGSTIVGGTLGVDVYAGTSASQGTNIASFTMATSIAELNTVISPSVVVAANGVVRVFFTKGSCTTADPIHVQLRGRYNI